MLTSLEVYCDGSKVLGARPHSPLPTILATFGKFRFSKSATQSAIMGHMVAARELGAELLASPGARRDIMDWRSK